MCRFFTFSLYILVLRLWKTDIHVKQVFKLEWWKWWHFNFLKSDYLLISAFAAYLCILPFPWRNTSLFSKVSGNNKKSDECGLWNIIHYTSSLWSGVSSILRIKGDSQKRVNSLWWRVQLFSKNLHLLPNSPCYLEGNPSEVTL